MIRHRLMKETPEALLADMKAHVARLSDDDDIVLEPAFASRIGALGEVAFIATIFRELQDSDVTNWMCRLAFAWQHLTFEEWNDVLLQIAEDRIAVYPFVWFAAQALALDVGAMIRSDPRFSDGARAVFEITFPNGACPSGDSPWWQEILADHGVDREQLLRRLAAQMAPLATVKSARILIEEMRHVVGLSDDEEAELPPEYAERIKVIGAVPFLVEACIELAPSDFRTWMLRLAFCWKDLTFEAWTNVFLQISVNRVAVHPFVTFAGEALALDVGELIRSDARFSDLARAVFRQAFPNGALPSTDSRWWQEMLAKRGIARASLVRRLASEGAPVKLL